MLTNLSIYGVSLRERERTGECSNCGTENDASFAFCRSCATDLRED